MFGSYSWQVMNKARDVPSEAITQSEADPSVWWVVSTRTGKSERVQILGELTDPSWVTCTCANGGHSGGKAKCYHAASVERRINLMEEK